MHRFQPEVQEQYHAAMPGRVGKLRKPKETHVVRIALTGGPCAGKSSVLARLTATATSAGFDVYVGPEVATVLFNCGFQCPTDPSEPNYDFKVYKFQKNLIKLGLQVERTMTSIAASTGRPSIIVFDRGLLDAKGYMPEETWKRVLDEVDEGRGVTENYMLGRYDGVVHLVTAADGAIRFYKWGNVADDAGNATFRREAPEEAVELDRKMQECWRHHPSHTIVVNGPGGFEEKLQTATSAILEVAHAVHPQE